MAERHARAVAQFRGQQAEAQAERYLRKRGLRLLCRNYRSRFGEVDIIMRDDNCIVFVEVRYRSANRMLPARLTVDRHKQRKLALTASLYLQSKRRLANCTVRFDVVAIDGEDPDQFDWLKDAFRPDSEF